MSGEKTTKVIIELNNEQNEFISNKLMKLNREASKFSKDYKTKSTYLTQIVGEAINKMMERNE